MSTVLLTGASGFIAMHVFQQLLEAGYTVRATVRSEGKIPAIARTFAAHDGKFSFVVVPDIAAEGAFDAAVVGVDYVVHTASPGTTNVLRAVQQFAPQVRHVVVTSSMAAIVDVDQGARPGYVYTEADWNPVTLEQGKQDPFTAYRASKKYAEKTAWAFVEREKPAFGLTVINPPVVWGPMLNDASLDALNTSNQMMYDVINGNMAEIKETFMTLWVDVRSVAQAHVRALTAPASAGQRYLVSKTRYSWSQVVGIIEREFPELAPRLPTGPRDVPPAGLDVFFGLDGSKAERDLGVEYIPLEVCVKDLVGQLVALERR
ncbi:uncharacterized protein V1510DRAFT_401428 [Dipodascopsis tothii]|uniref:uncharacterized protein n=1 Tax=Dipodascopsis tothii TaxID=44089 RepID=UPI0034CF1361